MNKRTSGISVVFEGFQILHSVAIRGGSYISRDHQGRYLPTYHEAYTEILGSIALLANTRLNNLDKPAEEVCESIFDQLIELHSSLGSFSLSEFAVSGLASAKEIVRRFNHDMTLSQKCPLNFENLPGIACRGYALIRLRKAEPPSIDRVFWSLALIGISSLFLRKTKKCAFCPRRTRIGGRYCSEHSQSDPSKSGRTQSVQYMRYRAGSNAHALSLKLKTKWLCNVEADGTDNLQHEIMMREILTASYAEFFKDWIDLMRMALQRAPRTSKLLGGKRVFSLKYAALVQHIRERLNPYVSDESVLMYVIYDFEIWFDLEAQVLSGRRRGGTNISGRIDQAIDMAKRGMRQIEIAKELGVSRSTVCGWASKYKTLSDALTAPSVTAES